MTLINSMEQNINLPGSIVCSDDFKDEFVDRILDIRDAIHDKFGDFPIIGVSVDKTIFWGCELRRIDMRDGLFDFYVEV